jgi:hypothetical protein
MMLFNVPGATSSLGLPGTVTRTKAARPATKPIAGIREADVT